MSGGRQTVLGETCGNMVICVGALVAETPIVTAAAELAFGATA